VRNLSFRYPQGENDCLKDISFSIEAGGFVGIVGMTGAGKSTLLKLLLKLYPIERGTICVSGDDITTLDTHQLRQMMGYVPQDSMLFSRSIRDNIGFAGSGDDSKIGDILHMTSLDQCIAEKEDGLDTLLGEKGHRLSGGQKQRVALARALIKQPKILLLDDVFSALDYQTQEQILSRMHDITAGRTVLLVSQRIAAVEKADMILVMEDGKIVERGTHDSLLAQKGLYYQLYARQSMKEGGRAR
jgi:ATP-binding cassette subfamily B protein